MNKIMKKVLRTILMLSVFSCGLTSCNQSSQSSSESINSISSINSVNQNVSSSSSSTLEEVSKQREIYNLAKASGYTGTYEEWLDSIKGDQIELTLKDNAIKWKYSTSSNWITLISLDEIKGEVGPKGPQGEKGEQGESGKSLLTGEGIPSDDLGNINDSYIDIKSWDYYVKETSGWKKVGNISSPVTPEKNHEGTEGLEFYPLNDNECAVSVGKAKYMEEIVVPSTYKGFKVTTIIDSGFAHLSHLKKITISEGIVEIGKYSFEGCSSLETVIIPSTTNFIDEYAFSDCLSLCSITLHKEIYNLASNVFNNKNMSIYYKGSSSDWIINNNFIYLNNLYVYDDNGNFVQIPYDDDDKPFQEKEKQEAVDYVSTLKFDRSSGRKFVKVNIKLLVDGDTSHFYIDEADKAQFPEGQLIRQDGVLKLRYLGIDTPESTGQIQEWGKTSSNFNKSKLSNATEIYVESNDGKWNLDSTGSRYLGYVWYKTAQDSELKCLNLEILQEGLSYAKSLGDLCYKDVFQKTYSQSDDLELRVFSKAASSWKFDDNSDSLIDAEGWILGSTKNNKNIISFAQSNLETNNNIHLFDDKYNLIDDDQDILNIIEEEENKSTKYEYYLGIEVGGKVNYFTGDITSGIAYTTTSQEEACKVYVEKDSTKSGYYNLYVNNENGQKDYITINSSNNVAYMNRDPNYYYGAYIETTIKGLRTYKEDYVGKLVRFECIVAKDKGDTIYVQQYDEVSGLTYGVQVYLGNNFSGKSLLKVGNKVSICGTFTYYEGGGTYQVSGLQYMKMKPNHEKNTKLIEEGVEVSLKVITAADLNKTTVDESTDLYEGISYTETLNNTLVKVENLIVNKVYTTNNNGNSDGAMTLTCTDSNGQEITVKTEVLTNEQGQIVVESDVLNKTITATGIVDCYNGSYQVKVFSLKDMIIA